MESQQPNDGAFLLSQEIVNESDLQSLNDQYFTVREVEEENSDLDHYSEESESDDDDDGADHFEYSEIDASERVKVQRFVTETCKCHCGENGKPCRSTIPLNIIVDCRNDCIELSSAELDIVILGTIHTCLSCNEVSSSGRAEKERERTRMPFYFHNKRICRKTFLFMHNISKERFYSLVKHYKKNGLSLRVHGNKNRLPSSTFQAETIERVVKFIVNMAEQQALVLPGRVPGFKRTDVKLLPSSLTKHRVWEFYQEACIQDGREAVGYSKFCDLWKQLCPFIIIMRPASDLCWTCQKNNNRIHKSANLPESQKADIVKEQEIHLNHATNEREYYQRSCKVTKENLKPHIKDLDFDKRRQPCSFDKGVHYSYDYAQQLHYPSDPYQPGPIYFKTARKCGIFGVCCEALPRQVNFLIDESVQTGKGANSTISYVHYFFHRHGLGECTAYVHADNCGAQNKNNAFIWYYMWRIMTGLHHSIEYNFLIAGHTKFSPDWCFGLLKQTTRKTFISSLFDIAKAVEDSAIVNTAELVGLHNGTVLVQAYDWTSYLESFFRKVPSIKKYHHFRFDKDHPGTVFCKEFCSSEEVAIDILKSPTKLPEFGVLPPVINPSGLSDERAQYLFKEIREFCRPGTEDLVAPFAE